MKIAVIVGGFPMISEMFILNQITGLIDLGHEVDIFARRRGTRDVMHADVTRYNLLARTHYFELPTARPLRVLRALAAFLTSVPWHGGALLRCLDRRRYRSLYAVLNNVMHAPAFLRSRYDAIVCQFGSNGIDFVFLKDLWPDVPFVTFFHKGELLVDDGVGLDVYSALRERGDLFLPTGVSWYRRKLHGFGFDDAKIVTHRLGVDVDSIPCRPRQLGGGIPEILTVARLHLEKGLEHSLRAVRALLDADPSLDLRYRIIGGGELRGSLSGLIERLRLSAHVELLGPLPNAQVLEWMLRSHIFLLPSLAEGTPTVLLEAQATGMPVIATDVGGVADIVLDGRSGFVVPAADVAALVDRLRYLLNNSGEWPQMGREGRRFVEEHHDIRRLNRRLSDLLARLVEGKYPVCA